MNCQSGRLLVFCLAVLGIKPRELSMLGKPPPTTTTIEVTFPGGRDIYEHQIQPPRKNKPSSQWQGHSLGHSSVDSNEGLFFRPKRVESTSDPGGDQHPKLHRNGRVNPVGVADHRAKRPTSQKVRFPRIHAREKGRKIIPLRRQCVTSLPGV